LREFIAVSKAQKPTMEAADRLPPALIFGGKGGRRSPLESSATVLQALEKAGAEFLGEYGVRMRRRGASR